MNISKYINQNDIHHLYILHGDPLAIRDPLFKFLSGVKVSTTANPDFHHIVEDALSIGIVRGVIESAGMSALSQSKKIFVIESRLITLPAQNAMLKLCEEPTADTHFFIVTPSRGELLPTLMSRARIIDIDAQVVSLDSVAVRFLSGSFTQRMEIIETIVKEKDRTSGQKLVSDMMVYTNTLDTDEMNDIQKKLLFVHNYITTPSSSLKMLLEYLALTLPKT